MRFWTNIETRAEQSPNRGLSYTVADRSETNAMSSHKMNVGVASNDRRMFEIVIPNIGKIVCETSTKLPGVTAGREDERKAMAKLNGKELSEALLKAIEGY